MTADDGTRQLLSPDEFARRLYEDQQTRSFFAVLLNVTSPVGFLWVGLGLLGQVLFTGRMIVQWLISEKKQRSVVPPAFWWMSLIGATMLLIYFLWRKEPVGVLGQATGWFIYVRNLWMIYYPAETSAGKTNVLTDARKRGDSGSVLREERDRKKLSALFEMPR